MLMKINYLINFLLWDCFNLNDLNLVSLFNSNKFNRIFNFHSEFIYYAKFDLLFKSYSFLKVSYFFIINLNIFFLFLNYFDGIKFAIYKIIRYFEIHLFISKNLI